MANPTSRTERVPSRKRHSRLVRILACLVVFCTTYALILPAITKEKTTFCGHAAHTHDESCWTTKLICGQTEGEGHIHDESCRRETQRLVCGQVEGEGHVHGESCWRVTEKLICGQEEREGHKHGQSCYETRRYLSCGQEESDEHSHSEACWTEESVLICTLAESEGHVHGPECLVSEKELICSLAEGQGHVHGPECYVTETELICGKTEGQGHVHTAECWEKVLSCKLEEHSHSLACYSNRNADLETQQDWEATLPEPEKLTGIWAKDLLAVAESQLHYKESDINYEVDEDETTRGYTRYGAWYGSPYGDWCAMYASFCLHYAGVSQKEIPFEASCPRWVEKLEKKELFFPAKEAEPAVGDLVFFDFKQNGRPDHVGIVTEVDAKKGIDTIEGNSANKVARRHYDWDDARVFGYGRLPENPERFGMRLSVETRHYNITLYYGKDAQLPADAELRATEYKENSEEFQAARDLVLRTRKSGEGEEEELGFAALDVSIVDAEGNEIEPAGPVRVAFTLKELPENMTAESLCSSMELRHLVDLDGELAVREQISSDSDKRDNPFEIKDDQVTATIEVSSLSPFTITWRAANNVNITFNLRYYDASTGDEITSTVDGSVTNTVNGDNQTVDLTAAVYARPIEGYELQAIRYNNTQVDSLQLTVEGIWVAQYYANFYRNGTRVARVRVYNGNTLNVDYFYQPVAPATEPVRISFNYADPNGVIEQSYVTVDATVEGVTLDLTQAPYMREYEGRDFSTLRHQSLTDYDQITVKLVENNGELVPACYFYKEGQQVGDLFLIPEGEDLYITYLYSVNGQEVDPSQVTLQIRYTNENGEMELHEFTVPATIEGNRINVLTDPYLKYFSGYEFNTTRSAEFEGFDTLEFLLVNGAPVVCFIQNGVYMRDSNNNIGYYLDQNVAWIEMNYREAEVGDAGIVNLNLHHVLYNSTTDSYNTLAQDDILVVNVTAEGEVIDLTQYVKSTDSNRVFAGCVANFSSADEGDRIVGFDTLVARNTSGGKIYELYQNGQKVGELPIVGDIHITYVYIDENDNSGGWSGGGTRPGGGTKPLPEPELDELAEATGRKTLESNGDGTYTLTLSLEVPKVLAETQNRANVVIIFDSSNSMNVPVDGNTWVRDDQHGTYALYNGQYYRLLVQEQNNRRRFFIQTPAEVTIGYDQNGQYCTKYTPQKTRLTESKSCVEQLVEQLLAYNTAEDPARVEIGFVEFASDIRQVQQPSTNETTIKSWVSNCTTPFQETQGYNNHYGGTNWDAALRIARGNPYQNHPNAVQFSDDDQKYIIFISDGDPTCRTQPDGLTSGTGNGINDTYSDGNRIGSYEQDLIPNVYGNGSSDPMGFNFNRAEEQASGIVEEGTVLINIGIYGDSVRMEGLSNNGYYEGSDEAGIRAAFNDIVSMMSTRLGYTNMSILDGITSMTSSTLVHGNPRDFSYHVYDRNGNDVTDQVLRADQRNAEYTPVTPSGDNNYEGGTVTWELGADELLLGGYTYAVSFIVWPEQEAYDLVADLNNGMRDFHALSAEEQAQVVGSGPNGDRAPFALRTNTRQSITYTPAQEVTDADGNVTITLGEPRSADLIYPEPMPLVDTGVRVLKEWNMSLDPSELEEYMEENPDWCVNLDLMKRDESGDEVYVEDIVIEPIPGEIVWPDTLHPEGYHISCGLMVSEAAAAESGLTVKDENDVPYYPTTTLDGTLYYILEPGRDYYFEEDAFDDSFELTEHTFHPMVVDGVKMDVTFSDDGHTVMEAVPFVETISAVNNLRGGISLQKVIVDPQGHMIDVDSESVFYIHCSITKKGQPLNPLEYRYYYDDGTRSEKFQVPDSSDFIVPLKTHETLRFVNIPTGCDYVFYEITGEYDVYEFYLVEGNFWTEEPLDPENPPYVLSDDLTTVIGVSIPNASQGFIFKNTRRSFDFEILKTDMVGGELLEGALFGLYSDEECTVPAKDAEGNDVASESTGPDGKLRFENLLPGTYWLKELTPPYNYVPIEEPIEVRITNAGMTYVINGEPRNGTVTVEEDGETQTLVFGAEIQNSTGYTMPHTGGFGTLPLTLTGLLLMGAASVFYGYALRRKRKGGRY